MCSLGVKVVVIDHLQTFLLRYPFGIRTRDAGMRTSFGIEVQLPSEQDGVLDVLDESHSCASPGSWYVVLRRRDGYTGFQLVSARDVKDSSSASVEERIVFRDTIENSGLSDFQRIQLTLHHSDSFHDSIES